MFIHILHKILHIYHFISVMIPISLGNTNVSHKGHKYGTNFATLVDVSHFAVIYEDFGYTDNKKVNGL